MIGIHIITLFPDSIKSYLNSSIIQKAKEKKKISFSFYNPMDYKKAENKRIDDRPYGGGPGMVLEASPVLEAYKKALGRKKNVLTIFFEACGHKFSAQKAKEFAHKYKHIILICGHYEGVDYRVKSATKALGLSIGDYILTGGELPALVVIDSVTREISGVLGNKNSLEHSRISTKRVYTRPYSITYKGRKFDVPKILISGDHKNILKWKKNNQ